MTFLKYRAMRLVCGKRIIEEVTRKGTFFWLLCEGRPENSFLLIETVAKVVEAWTPPQTKDLTEAMVSSWVKRLKFKCLVELYLVFGAKHKGEATLAAVVWS